MCGVAGILNFDKSPVSRNIIKKMSDVIAHRGPDGEGIWVSEHVGLGHRRLAILDLSSLGKQPMISDDGNMIISYNGEIYNYVQIRETLTSLGYKFRSNSDTEVVLKAFQEWGSECLHKFNGMFAIAIYNISEDELFLARDRYGIKPLYVYHDSRKIVFASEIKSILQHPDIETDLSIKALNEYFSFQNIFSNLTFFEGIKLIPAATYTFLSCAKNNGLNFKKYWDYNFAEDLTITEKDAISETSRLFEQAVNRQLIGEVELGTFLSGGMDSGAITAIAAKNFKNLKSFTCGFDLSSASGLELNFDERQKAEFLSNRYKTEHYEIVLKAGDMERIMPELIWHLEDPRVGQCYPNFYISRLAGKFVKVTLAGTGGDELFAGYPWRYYRAVVNDYPEQYLDKYYRYWQRLISDSEKPSFYQPDIYPQIWDYQTKNVFKSVMELEGRPIMSPEEYINKSLYFESKTFLHGLLCVEDKLSMANGLETRVPFLDNDLVDFAMKIPVKYKLKNLTEIIRINENEPGRKTQKYYEKTNDGKIILRKVLSNYVPELYTNGIKQGFSAPDASWFKGESIDYIRDLLFTNNAEIYKYLQPQKVQSLMTLHFEGKENKRLLIWSLLCFEWWLRVFK
jgi:asparagine synthase (glutamine-hydrolysing)